MPSHRFPPSHPVVHTPAVWHPEAPREGYAVVLLRRRFTLPRPLRNVRLWVSASERYILWLDGRLVSRGPSRSDAARWGCVRVRLGRLAAGPHVLAATAFHRGPHAGIGQMGGPAFFLLHGECRGTDLAPLVDTGEGWRCIEDRSRTPLAKHAWGGSAPYDAVGSGERVDGSLAPWGWEQLDFDDAGWAGAQVVCRAAYSPWGDQPLEHVLGRDPLPPMEEKAERLCRVAESPPEYRDAAARWIAGDRPLTVGPRARVRLLLDRGEVTNAYPVLTVSGGRGARIRLVTAEAPFIGPGRAKGNRDETAGKQVRGHQDEFRPDGGPGRALTTLWFRSFRYVELSIETAGEALALDRFAALATGYPLGRRARFRAGGPRRGRLRRVWDVSWRTARLCAHETFFDCPHYEQAQFPGDSRVQALFHYLVAGDDRLARKAMDDFHASRLAEGLTQCRYPSRRVQVIPTFSLYWIGMLHDFRVYRGDLGFLRRYVDFAREVLAWFERRRRGDGMLGFVEHAPFVDWTAPFACGNAPQDAAGGSAILTLLVASACVWQAGLEAACGFAELVPRWRRLGRSLVRATLRTCWDGRRRLLADTARKRTFSVHAQVEAVLAGAWPPARARRILRRALEDPAVTQPGTLYYRFYVAQALKACGLRSDFFALLKRWEDLLEGTGLTTWPESDQDPRSDCHAWSVTPAIEFLQTVLGVEPDPAAHGFSRLRFEPALGPLEEASGTVPTPHGPVRVDLRRRPDGTVSADLRTPVPAVVASRERPLAPGRHRLRLPAHP